MCLTRDRFANGNIETVITNTLNTSDQISLIITFIVYLVGMLLIGYWAWTKTDSSADYFLGGRSLSPWPAALSAGASDMSGWLLLGLPGYAYLSGLEASWIAIGLIVGSWLNWRILAKRLRVYSERLGDAITLPEYFSNRFHDTSRLLQWVSAIFILLFFLFYTSSGLVAGGKLFSTVFGFSYEWAVIIGCLCIVGYTLFGGFLAVAWTDLVQGLLMAAALAVVPIIVWTDLPAGNISDHVHAINPELLNPFTDNKGTPLTFIAIASLLAWGLGYFGQPHILTRFAAVRTAADIKPARRIAIGWTFIALLCALSVGLVGLVFTTEQGTSLEDSETIFMVLVSAVFHPVVAGILLAAILAAIMSTADSQLLVSSSAFANDLYKALWRRSASPTEVLWVSRISVLAISVIATSLALVPGSSVLGLVSYAWAGFGAAFGPALLISLYWKEMSKYGALAGIVVGGVVVVLWKQVSGGIFDLYEIVPGFVLSSLAIVVVSKMTPPHPDVADHHQEIHQTIEKG